jgi:hypothetical protein
MYPERRPAEVKDYRTAAGAEVSTPKEGR